MNDVAALQLEREIQSAFGPVPYPGDDRLLNQPEIHSLEREEILSDFSGRHWSVVAAEAYAYHHEALVFFSPEAFQFFLPGYLIACIRSHDILSKTIGSIHFSLTRSPRCTPTHELREGIAKLTPQQRKELGDDDGSLELLLASDYMPIVENVCERVDVLTSRQRNAALHFFELIAREYPDQLSHDELEAVRESLVDDQGAMKL